LQQATAKSKKLAALNERMHACRSCPLHKGRTNVVTGDGNIDARIMVVGEAPGRNEDESGQPFVGMAGKFLNTLLEQAKLRREDVFVSNIVKCRPPDNRKPEQPEIDACADFLKQQIRIIDPKLIICLGGTAAWALLGLKQIGDQHGKLIERDGRFYFLAYHPAARFHRTKIREDFEALRKELKKIPLLAGKST
jgi:uracil-DNA glycosylase family 4